MNELIKIDNGNITLSNEYAEKYKQLLKLQKELELGIKEVNQFIKDYMEETGNTEPIKVGSLVFSYKKASTRTSIDSKRLKEECPDIYEEYSKTSSVSSSISVNILDDDRVY